MATGDGVTFQFANPVPIPLPPLTTITPFTYRDGTTYLEQLQAINYYIQYTLIPEVNSVITDAQSNLNSGIAQVNAAEAQWATDFQNFMNSVNTQLQALNDTAMAALVNSPTSATTTALAAIYAAKSTVDGLVTLTSTGRLSQASLDAAYASLATVNASLADHDSRITANANAVASKEQKWQPNTVYTAGTQLVSPAGDTVTALQDHTSGAVFDPLLYTGNFGFLFACHNDGVQEKLNLYYSPDGRTVVGGTGNPVYTPASTGHSLRDPSLKKIGDTYFVAYTANNGFSLNLEIAQSTDLVNWTLTQTIDVHTLTNIRNAWAPELIRDTDGSYIIVFTVVRTDAGNPHDIYWIRANDNTLTSWTAPRIVQWTGLSQGNIPIDPTVIHYNGQWYAFYGNDGVIQRATFTNWGDAWNTDKAGDWAGFISAAPDAPNHRGYEGPEIVDFGSGHFRLYLDEYRNPDLYDTGYVYSDSFDGMATWSTPKKVGKGPGFPSDSNVRHGAWYKLHSLTEMVQAMGVAFTGPRKHHAEFYTAPGSLVANTLWNGNLTEETVYADNPDEICSLSGNQVTILRDGVYALHLQIYSSPQAAMGGGWMAIKAPDESVLWCTNDVPASATAWTVSTPARRIAAGTVIKPFIEMANSIPYGEIRMIVSKMQ